MVKEWRILDRTLFGDLASSTLDCGVFLDRSELRKSAELAWISVLSDVTVNFAGRRR